MVKKEIEFFQWIMKQFPNIKTILVRKYCMKSIKIVAALFLTLLLGMMVEVIFYENDLNVFVKLVGIYICVFLLYMILDWRITEESKYLHKEIDVELRVLLYRKEIRSKGSVLDRIEPGENMQLFTQDVENLYYVLNQSLETIVTAILGIISIFAIMCVYNLSLAVVVLFFSLLIVFMSNFSKEKYNETRKKFRRKSSEYVNWIHEHLKGMRDIRMNQAEKMVQDMFLVNTNENLEEKEKIRFIEIKAERIVGFVSSAFTVIFWAVSAVMILNDSLTVGLFYVINKYFGNVINYLSSILQERVNIRNDIPGCEKIKVYCELEAEQKPNTEYYRTIENKGTDEISFRQVDFSYADQKILNHMNVVFNKGSMNVIVGENGAGKTTLMNLILRFYQPDKGMIKYAGNPVEKYELYEWRKRIGYVQQENMIFEGSLKKNIRLCVPDISEKQVWQILKTVGLFDTVMGWEEKLDTDLKSGERLSEGQKQRVAIARVVAKEPEIIIMDEPTANLDYDAEKMILSDIKEICKDKILIIITHRETVVKEADEIFVMKDGKMTSGGAYEENTRKNRSLSHDISICQ